MKRSMYLLVIVITILSFTGCSDKNELPELPGYFGPSEINLPY